MACIRRNCRKDGIGNEWARGRDHPKQHRITFDLAYWLQFIGLTLSGGIVALARDLSLPANPLTPIDALYVGLSLPVLFKPAAEQLMGFAKEKNPGDDGE